MKNVLHLIFPPVKNYLFRMDVAMLWLLRMLPHVVLMSKENFTNNIPNTIKINKIIDAFPRLSVIRLTLKGILALGDFWQLTIQFLSYISCFCGF